MLVQNSKLLINRQRNEKSRLTTIMELIKGITTQTIAIKLYYLTFSGLFSGERDGHPPHQCSSV